MTIDRLGGIDPLQNAQNTQKPRRVADVKEPDTVSVSSEARQRAEVYFAMEAASVSPDVRADRVAEVMQKMKDPAYVNNSVVDLVADRIMNVYGL